MKKSVLLALALLGLAAVPAWAHFVWIATAPNAAGKPAVHILFGEDAIACEANLLDNVKQTQVWAHAAGQQSVAVKLEKEVKGEHGTWMAPLDLKGKAFTATCEYGISSRGKEPYLLVYHAKHLDATQPDALQNFARIESVKLDIVPTINGEAGELQVLFDGKPAVKSQVMIWTPDKNEKETEQFTDDNGKVKFKVNQKGLWQIRARHQNDVPGKRGGKEFPFERHYSTLVLKNGEAKTETAGSK